MSSAWDPYECGFCCKELANVFAFCRNFGESELPEKSARAAGFGVSAIAISKEALGFDVALVGCTTGKIVDGES